MPIEIRELIIKVSVTSPDASQTGGGNSSSGTNSGGNSLNSKEGIVAECVEKVMEILQHKTER